MLSIRKIAVIRRTYRHLNRYQQILRIFFKYGFQEFIDTLRLEEYLEIGLQLISRKIREKIERLSRAERFRLALEELGPTFIKLGQILSTRPDLIPPEYITELAKLQDHVPPFPYELTREIIKAETGLFPEELFHHFEKIPLAAGSIGQVHKARLHEGEEVVVKVQRPGIRRTIEVDLEIMFHLASLAERHLEEIEVHHPSKIVEEFARTLEKEIDYTIEVSNIERFARQFLADDAIYVPKIFHEICTERILTMEYIDGIKVSEVERLQEQAYDLKKLAERGALSILQQIFVHGFFHADPHPGNIFILPHDIVCYLDFGMMGRISTQDQEDFTDLIMAVVRIDAKKVGNALLRMTYYQEEPDRSKLDRDLAEFMDQHLFKPLKDLDAGKLLHQILDIVKRYGLRLKPDLFLLMKAISSIEGVGRKLNPDFEIFEHLKPFVLQIQANRRNPQRIAGDVYDSGLELFSLLKETPRELQALLKLAKEGKIKIEFEHQGLERMYYTHDRISNRLAFSIVLAALLIASALIVLSGIPPTWHEVPIIGLTGFLVSGVMGFWLLLTSLRHGRL